MKRLLILLSALVLCSCAAGTDDVQTSAATSAATTAETPEDTEKAAEITETSAEETSSPAAVASGDETIAAETVVPEGTEPVPADKIAKGTYEHVEVRSSSSMFRVADCTLEVSDSVTARLYFDGSAYGKLYTGTAEEAAAEPDNAIERPETDGGYYFDIPVEALDKGFSLAAFSVKKEKWYDREVALMSASLPAGAVERTLVTAETLGLADGEYTAAVTLSGGSGRASVDSPAHITVQDGNITAEIRWSSDKYDYMIVGGEKYLPVNTEGNSVFEIPVESFDTALAVHADTTAMSVPYEIEYTLYFDSATISEYTE